MGMVIAILSGKGGTGKTTVCAGLGTGLAAMGKKVLCVDLDVDLRNLDIALGMPGEPALAFTEVSQGDAPLEDAARHPMYPELRFLTAPVGGLTPDPEAFGRMVLKARAQFDYILLDAPAGVGPLFRMAARYSSLQLLVTGPDPASLRDGAQVSELLELMGKADVRLVVNRISVKLYRDMNLTVDDVMDLVGCPLLGLVPEDRNVVLAAVGERPLMAVTRRGAAAALSRVARRLCGQKVPLMKIK